jgi:hypothetical protein
MKNENSTLIKRLKSYSALAGSMLAMVNIASGQIIYTDVDPDVMGTDDGAHYDLDLNNDGTVDFNFHIKSDGAGAVKMSGAATSYNAIAGTYSSPYKYPSVFELDDVIDDGLTWVSGGTQTMASSGYYLNPYGNWFDQTDKYLGVRLNLSGNDHYGWVRLDVSADGHSFTVKDYAYESASATSILAGAGANVGVNEINENGFIVYAFEKQIHVQLKDNSNGKIIISNMLGQQIKLVEINSSLQTIEMSSSSVGIHLVTVYQNGTEVSKKVVLQ